MVKVQIIYNPVSGTHCDLKLEALQLAFQACGAAVTFTRTNINGEVDFDGVCDLVCVSGGDGALRLVVQAAVKCNLETPICVYPAGTVNLIAREIGYDSNPDTFASEVMAGLLLGDSTRLHAPVIVHDHQTLVACLSASPDGLAVANHDPALKKRFGEIAYALAGLKLMFHWPRLQFNLEIVQGQCPGRALSCAAFYIAKGHHYAGNWTLVPEARLESEQFYVLALRSAGRIDFLRFMLHVARGQDPANLGFVEKIPARSLRIKSCSPDLASHAFQVDGDAMDNAPEEINITNKSIVYSIPKVAD